MPLPVGTRLGPYEILSAIGSGGMGDVYKARDARLERTVAIKILPSADPGLKKRFEREAKVIASLTHPHICTLYDVGTENDTDFLVLEYLQGETLADRLERGPLKLDDALKMAMQVTDALDRAHRAGIVHRDLKPANIMLTERGIKLLDFGLAKLRPQAAAVSGFSAGLTRSTSAVTSAGSILGTLQYMAPEQLNGAEADERSDIWAFGCVLYEMLTGKKAFTGDSAASVIGAILRDEPPKPVPDLGADGFLNDLVRSCLAKAADDRVQSIHDVRLHIASIAARARPGETAGPPTRPAGRFALGAAAALLIGALGLAVTILVLNRRAQAQDGEALTLSVLPAPDTAVSSSPVPLAFSPDGRALAYIAADAAGVAHLWYRPLDGGTPRALPETAGASQPFFSPDGTRLGFFADGVLKTIGVTAGGPRTLAPAAEPFGGTWGADNVILYVGSPPEGVLSVSSAGGDVHPVIPHDPGVVRLFSNPSFLPDGHHFLYARLDVGPNGPVDRAVYVTSVDGGTTRKVLASASNVAYTAPGFLLYMQDHALLAQPFDIATLEMSGSAQPLVEQVQVNRGGAFAASLNGRLAYVSGAAAFSTRWTDRAGRPQPALNVAEEFSLPALSPDDRWLAGQRLDANTKTVEIWSRDLKRGITSRLTHGQSNTSVVWSGDSSFVLYAALRQDQRVIEAQRANQETQPEVIARFGKDNIASPESMTADGRFLSFRRTDPVTKDDVWVLPLTGERKPFPFMSTAAAELQSRFSPDGHWLAYTSDESGSWQVYLQPFPATGGKWQISVDGGGDPQWRGDSQELFYLRSDRMLMSVPIHAGPAFVPSVATPLFVTRVADLVGVRNHYVVSHDGQRFMFTTSAEDTASAITVVLNWPAQFKK